MEPRISLGNIINLIALVAGGFAFWLSFSERITVVETKLSGVQEQLAEMRSATGDRWTRTMANDAWARQQRIDDRQDALLEGLRRDLISLQSRAHIAPRP